MLKGRLAFSEEFDTDTCGDFERVHVELIGTSRKMLHLFDPYRAIVGQRANTQGFRPATFLALSERSDGDYGFVRRRQVDVMVGRGGAARGYHT